MKWFFIYLIIFSFGYPEKIKLNLEINGIKKSGKLFLAVYDDPLVFESNKSKEFKIKTNVIAKLIEDTNYSSSDYLFKIEDASGFKIAWNQLFYK